MRVALVSGSRADQAALLAVKEALKRAGVPYKWFNVHTPRMTSDTPLDVAQAAGMACKWIAGELSGKHIDLVLLHGDRYEILGAATAAFLLGLPVGHIGGGDITAGSQDNSIRNAITKLSHLHFTSCKESAELLKESGERMDRVFNVGDPGTDLFHNKTDWPTRQEMLQVVGLPPNILYFLVAFHPNTLGDTKFELKLMELAIRKVRREIPEVGFILLGPNKDAGHQLIERKFKQLAGKQVKYWEDLPRPVYLSALTNALALVGNSSAAFYEAPSTGTPIIVFGNRQHGRKYSDNWVGTVNSFSGLYASMINIYNGERPKCSKKNPYSTGQAADNIASVVKTIDCKALLLKKAFI